MKKIITALMLLMLSVPMLRSQSSEEHLKFKGIPITGSKENFVKELKKQGFKSLDADDKILEGVFAQQNCPIVISTTPITKEVYSVSVVFENFNTWTEIKYKFNQLEEQLYKKYKVSPEYIKEFAYPYEEGDGYEMVAIELGKCIYISRFKVANGIIQISISKSGNIFLGYYDSEGKILDKQEESQLLQSDL